MRDEAMHVRLVEWAQWRRVGDGSGYPTMSVLHEDWSPPSPGVTPTMKVSTSVSVHVTHRAMASWSGRMRNTIAVHYLANLPIAEHTRNAYGLGYLRTDQLLRLGLDPATLSSTDPDRMPPGTSGTE